MNSSLPRLTVLVSLSLAAAAWAQAPRVATRSGAASTSTSSSTANGPHRSAGDQLLLQAATQIEQRDSVAARLRHSVHLPGRDLYGIGSYWQQGRGPQLRVRLELQIAGQESSLLQVSSSRFCWTDLRLPTGRSVTRVDLRQLRSDPIVSAGLPDETRPGEASWSSVEPDLALSQGGLPALLASLGEHFTFSPPQAMRLTLRPPAVVQPTVIPVYAVVGRWKAEKLAALLPAEKANGAGAANPQASLQDLPAHVPHEVLLLVGQVDLFPYRIEYRRLPPGAPAQLPADQPYQLSTAPLVLMELADVAFDVQITAGQFDYAPGDADWEDRTARELERIRSKRQQQLAARSRPDYAAPAGR